MLGHRLSILMFFNSEFFRRSATLFIIIRFPQLTLWATVYRHSVAEAVPKF